jgi:hypothetical protein
VTYRPENRPTLERDLEKIIEAGFQFERHDRLGNTGSRTDPPGDVDAVAEYVWDHLLVDDRKDMLASIMLRALVVAEHKRQSSNQP